MVSWEAWHPPGVFGQGLTNQPRYRLSRIADGEFDGFIRAYARAIRRFGGPTFIRLFHEMDGNWYPWGGTANGNTPEDFVAAWRHVHRLFRAAGATNVTWVWSVNNYSVPATPENSIHRYWPGSRYVDWIGISGFNRGPLSPDGGWHSFDSVFASRFASLSRYRKPVVIAEIGTPERGGDKAAWITDAFGRILSTYPSVRAVVWYDKRDSSAADWRIGSSAASAAAFRDAIGDRRVLSAPRAVNAARRRR